MLKSNLFSCVFLRNSEEECDMRFVGNLDFVEIRNSSKKKNSAMNKPKSIPVHIRADANPWSINENKFTNFYYQLLNTKNHDASTKLKTREFSIKSWCFKWTLRGVKKNYESVKCLDTHFPAVSEITSFAGEHLDFLQCSEKKHLFFYLEHMVSPRNSNKNRKTAFSEMWHKFGKAFSQPSFSFKPVEFCGDKLRFLRETGPF